MPCFLHRILGGIFLAAHLSLYFQYGALYGANGILPLHHHLQGLREQDHLAEPSLSFIERFHHLPSLLIFAPDIGIRSDIFGEFLILCGLISSLLICFGSDHTFFFLISWISYVSIVLCDGGTFLSFHWDILLVEVGFLAIFSSLFMVDGKSVNSLNWCYRFLVWKLIFVSAVNKLQSNAPIWSQLRALEVRHCCLSLSLCLISPSLSVSLSLSLSVSLSLSLSLSLCLSFSLSLSLSLSLCLSFSLSLSLSLCFSVSLCLSLSLSHHLSVSVCL
jgi:hypothetical protein